MKFLPAAIGGAYWVELEPHADERGFFARTWCAEELAARGLVAALAQCSVSYNRRRGTLRGMHWQAKPHEEAKLVACPRGAAWDVMLDLREGSPTWGRWDAAELSARNRRMAYLPPGVAHGFQTLEDETDVLYYISTPYQPASARGARFDDPRFAIAWPLPDPIVSERDRAFPLAEAAR